MKYIQYGNQTIDKSDIQAVSKALKSKFLTTGPLVNEFEKKLSTYVNAKYALACNSGTAALHMAFVSIDLKKNENVIIPTINFISAANVCKIIGANIFFADVDEYTGQVTPDTINNCIKKNKIKKLKAICIMHHGGLPFNSNYLKGIKKKFHCFIIEDCCHSLGGKYSIKKNENVGNCKYSDLSTFSFHPVKTITTAEGGMLTTNNRKLFNKAKLFRNHGIKKTIEINKNNWSYKIYESGLNYRLSEIHAALGISQLKKIEKFIKKRNLIANQYNLYFRNTIVRFFDTKMHDIKSAYHLYIINIDFEKLKINKNQFIQKLHQKKIGVQVHYIPNHTQPLFKKKLLLPNSDKYFKNSLSLPIYPNLKKKEVKKISNIVLDLIKKYKIN